MRYPHLSLQVTNIEYYPYLYLHTIGLHSLITKVGTFYMGKERNKGTVFLVMFLALMVDDIFHTIHPSMFFMLMSVNFISHVLGFWLKILGSLEFLLILYCFRYNLIKIP